MELGVSINIKEHGKGYKVCADRISSTTYEAARAFYLKEFNVYYVLTVKTLSFWAGYAQCLMVNVPPSQVIIIK